MRVLLCAAAIALAACGNTIRSGDGDEGGARDATSDRTVGDSGKDGGETGHRDSGTGHDAGPRCYANTDCEGGTCSYSQTVCADNVCTTSQGCPGSCVPYAVDGGPCFAPGPPTCPPDSGLICDPFSHRCVPSSSETLPVVDVGAACGLGVAFCSPDAFCDTPTFPNDGVCTSLIEDGGACDFRLGGCATGLVCVGASSDASLCRPPWPAGGPCVEQDAGGTSGCNDTERCVDGGCVPLPSTGPCLDGACDPDAGYCNSTGTCVARSGNGSMCTSASECTSRLCASTTDTCVALLPLGAACTGPYDCTKDLCAGDDPPGCESDICDMTNHCAESMCPRPKDAGQR